MAPRQPYSGSSKTRPIESGALAARKQDLVAHSQGTTLRHTAGDIDINPVLSGAFNQTSLQNLLQTITDFITESGEGFISIGGSTGDGYDAGDFNVTSSFHLEDAIEAAQLSPRLQQGGIILIKSGTYRLNRAVTLRQGICIFGESSGTLIISATNQQAMFIIPTSPTPPDLGNWLGVTPNPASTGVRYNRFYNIILADNLDGYKGASPTIPNTITAGNLGLIQCNRGSYLICEKVTFLGKVNTTLNPEVVTRRAIDYIGNSNNPTVLTMEACYFDAFENCVTFTPTNSKNFLSIKGCRMRFLGQNTGSPPADRASAISFNICNANIEGNYILGDTSAKYAIQLRNFALADSQLLEASSATDDLIPRIVLIGNSGGLAVGSAAERAQNFFINSSSNSAFRMVNTGNTWGTNPVSPWGVVIGDGITSIGDINGTKALDVATLASQNSRSESAIYINPGNYTYTTAGDTSTFPRLIGNIRGTGQRPVVSLSSSSTDSLSRKQVFAGSEIRNIKFTSVSTFHAVTINTGTSNTLRNFVVDNCEFLDAGLQTITFTNSTIQSLETRVSVLNTRFSQSGSFADNLSCYIVGEIDHILLENSTFIGHGYALRTIDSSSTYNQKIKLDNVYFDGAGDGVTDMISVDSPSALNSYVLISSPSGSVNFNNVKVDSVISTPSETFPVKASLRSSGSFVKYIDVSCKDFIADNCVLLFPQQTTTVSSVTYGLVGLFVGPINTLSISNSQISGSVPLRIGGSSSYFFSDATSGETSGAYCYIKNCVISGYPGATGTIVNSSMLDLDMPVYTGNRNSGKPQIIVDGCKIDNYIRGTNYYPAQHTSNTTTNYRGAGGVVIIAKGWTVNFTNNLVHILQPNIDVTGISALVSSLGTFGVFIDTLGDGSGSNGSLRNAYINITNNNIDFNTAGTAGGASYIHASLYFRTAFGIVSNNFINFTSQTITESTPYRIYLGNDMSANDDETTNKSSCIISKNIFERYQGLSKALIVFNGASIGYNNHIFSDNIFIGYEVIDSSLSPQFVDNTTFKWTKIRNKNQKGIIRLNGSNGTVLFDQKFNDKGSSSANLTINTTSSTFSDVYNGVTPLEIVQDITGSNLKFSWTVPLLSILPLGCRVTAINISVTIDNAWTTGSLRMRTGGKTTVTSTATMVLQTATTFTNSINYNFTGPTDFLDITQDNAPYLVIDAEPALAHTIDVSGARLVIVNYVEVVYLG